MNRIGDNVGNALLLKGSAGRPNQLAEVYKMKDKRKEMINALETACICLCAVVESSVYGQDLKSRAGIAAGNIAKGIAAIERGRKK